MVRAVCFNPAKRPLLEKYQKGRTAVRLHNITSSIKDDIESIIIQNNTTVQPLVVPFVYQDAATSSSLPSLSSLQEASKEQLVDVKAKVSSMGRGEVVGRFRPNRASIVGEVKLSSQIGNFSNFNAPEMDRKY